MTGGSPHPPRVCVIGWPATHSRSPLIHRFWLEELKIAGSYELAAVPPGEFDRFIANLAEAGYKGANVTLPHKRRAFELCAGTTGTARRLGAVNTLWLEEGRLRGDNTDVTGFLAALDQDAPGWDTAGGKAVILGAGGAARAILFGLLSRGIEEIILVNRTVERAAALAGDFGPQARAVDFSCLPEALNGANLLINTTSLGMQGQPPLVIDLSPLPEGAVVNDIVYVPVETALLKAAAARGLRTVPGVGMLLHQAVPGFERWFGVKPGVTAELRRLVEADISSGR
ncbi:MAG TPA: shikimate dehydrogenase [Methylocella sp.]|nr:shikimate dehydrogenase [Methylocella sp.]